METNIKRKNNMTDLKTFLIMISNSNESFEKRKSGNDWLVKITNREIEFYFDKDEKFKFCCTSK